METYSDGIFIPHIIGDGYGAGIIIWKQGISNDFMYGLSAI
jgi:hypothetical protein